MSHTLFICYLSQVLINDLSIGQAIFSVDIHPDGSRFATAGQGDGGNNGKVIVWNMRPLLNEEDENNEEVPKALSIMDGHQGNRGSQNSPVPLSVCPQHASTL